MPVSADMQDHPLITITSDRLIGSQPLCFEVLNAGITWQSREVRAFGLDSRPHAGAGQEDHHDPWRHLPDGKQQKAPHGERKIARHQDRAGPDRAIEGGT